MLEVSGLSKSFGGFRAVSDVGFTVDLPAPFGPITATSAPDATSPLR